MSKRPNDYRLFWQEFRRTFQSTGAVLPSGPALCRALAAHVPAEGSRRILEVGPGTGVVTTKIAQQMGPADTLDIVELNERFVERLQQRMDEEEQFADVRKRVRIHQMPVQEFKTEEPFDAIVSGLPLNNFPVDLVNEILSHFERLAAENATISFFEYVGVRKAKSLFARQPERLRLAGIEKSISDICGRLRFDRQCVMANVPPAWVHHLRTS
ncbi:MAG: methyltransferase domain-containing protein [Lacipirellulaceae bacterium]